MRLWICIIGLFLFVGCPGDGGSGLPDTAIPSESPKPGLFDIWTLKAVIQNTDCGAGLIGRNMEEEYRIYEVESGCAISDEDQDGKALTNDEKLFDEEDTLCHSGGDLVTFEYSPKQVLEGCSLSAVIAARLTLSGDTLNGEYGGNMTAEGSCPKEVKSCKATATLTGKRGRHAPLAFTPTVQPLKKPSTSKALDMIVVPEEAPKGFFLFTP